MFVKVKEFACHSDFKGTKQMFIKVKRIDLPKRFQFAIWLGLGLVNAGLGP